MAEALLLVMLVAAALYAVLGGADFGVGIIEPWLGPDHQRDVDAAILPVWEANHVWLVLVVVLAFVGFPALFVTVSTYLHLPLLGLLLGIVARGSAFTFRHYDPAPGAALRSWYSWAFRAGSLLAPLCLGIILAACVQGTLETDAARGAYALFVAPWNTAFCWASGLFVCALFAFQGAALLAAEHAARGAPLPLLRLARRLHAGAVGCGALVLASAAAGEVPWFRALWTQPLGWGSLLVASLLIPLVAYAFHRGRPWLLRLAVGAQVTSVLVGLFGTEYPTLLRLRGFTLSVADAAAPPATLRGLAIAVGIGLLLILPAFAALLRVYKVSGK
jgi:cytochrome d ubiquinol oxidase subunit II